jgi:hypothetical protein
MKRSNISNVEYAGRGLNSVYLPWDRQFQWCNESHTLGFIQYLVNEIQSERKNRKWNSFTSELSIAREMVQNKDVEISEHVSALETTFSKCHDMVLKISTFDGKKRINYEDYPVQLIQDTFGIRPRAKFTVCLKNSYAADDQKDLTFVPYLGEKNVDDDHTASALKELFDTKKRERLMESGPEYIHMERTSDIDKVLAEILKASQLYREGILEFERETFMFRIQRQIQSCIEGVEFDDVIERCKVSPRSPKKKRLKTHSQKINSHKKETNEIIMIDDNISYIDLADTFRHLFCRRCIIYDCNRHGIQKQENLEIQTSLAIAKEIEDEWSEDSIFRSIHDKGNFESLASTNRSTLTYNTDLTQSQKALIDRIFNMNMAKKVSDIATAIGANASAVELYMKQADLTVDNVVAPFCQFIDPKNKKRRKKNDKSMNIYNPKWLANIQSVKIHPAFNPCDHKGLCSESSCTCVKDGFFCTKHCIFGKESKNFFRGCSCKQGSCRLNNCSCFAAKRECDPDLCLDCGTCSDPPGPTFMQRCRNDNISMRRHCHLLLAESEIQGAGWGIFTKNSLKRGDFIAEYVGEVISQEEADRRGHIYDKKDMSYLFNLTSETCIDACRKGNKTKFMNHSSTPNCEPKIFTVNGDSRVGIFAKEDIEAQSELFFDYRFDKSVCAKDFEKTAVEMPWMKKESKKASSKKSTKHNANKKFA